MNEFVSWEMLATFAGAVLIVSILCQFTKGICSIDKIPTQIWSYILSLIVLYPAMFFTGQLNGETAVLTIFNGILVSIAANGGYSAVLRILGKNTDGELLIDDSDPNKDIYRLAVGSLDGLADKNTVTLQVKTGQDLSHPPDSQ